MSHTMNSTARAVADLSEGVILATVEIKASPERVFLALTSREIIEWWVRPGVFDTREWTGDLRVGGRWEASGVGKNGPYSLEGEFLEIDTREWTGDLRVGGRWEASGVGKNGPYSLEGEFLEIDPPRRLVHTWHPVGAPAETTSTVTYKLEPVEGGTRITLRQSGIISRDSSLGIGAGWETSFQKLEELLG
jgi:uncharacterized protein YndB with AHSA1/START domain